MRTVVRDIAQHFYINQFFWLDQQGQDLTEYALLLAFIVIAAASLFVVSGTSILTIWGVSNNIMTAAAHQAQGS
jgi:Flp pilus assembly pilin Flp